MTDLTEMVEWLRATVGGDLRKAEACAGAPWCADIHGVIHVHANDERSLRSLGFVASVQHDEDRQHIATHDPADTIARCEAELEIIDAYEDTRRLSEENNRDYRRLMLDPAANADRLPSNKSHGWELVGRGQALQFALQSIAYGRRHRPGWKEEWKP